MDSPPPKPRWPYATALATANQLVEVLAPCALRITIAGSLRREKPTVGDIEILYIPRTEDRPGADLFRCETMNLFDEKLNELLRAGTLTKRPNKNGSYTWGKSNKLAVHKDTQIPVDLFATSIESWFNYLVCRTGPADSNTLIATRAKERYLKWSPYSPGFIDLSRKGDNIIPMTSEEQVFETVGLPFRPPRHR